MARMAVEDGISKIICTPHVTPSPEGLAELAHHACVLETLQLALQEEGIPLTLLSGAELMLTPDLFAFVKKNPLARLAETKAFLFEINSFIPLNAIPPLLFSARLAGLQPILAHPERYPQTMAEFNTLETVCEHGALLQLTAMSLTGEFGRDVQRCAEKIIKHFPNQILIATDSHDRSWRKPLLSEAYKVLPSQVRLAAQEHCQRMFTV